MLLSNQSPHDVIECNCCPFVVRSYLPRFEKALLLLHNGGCR